MPREDTGRLFLETGGRPAVWWLRCLLPQAYASAFPPPVQCENQNKYGHAAHGPEWTMGRGRGVKLRPATVNVVVGIGAPDEAALRGSDVAAQRGRPD